MITFDMVENGMVTKADGQMDKLVTEASTLRFPPGKWPESISTELGNTLPFRLISLTNGHGRYRQANGCIDLLVLND